MKSTSKTVVCKQPGLSQEEALNGLYEAYGDVRVASIKRRGEAWVATIQQKLAEFPPSDSGDEESDGPPKKSPPEGGGDSEESGPPSFEEESDGAPDGLDGPPGLGGDEGGESEGGELHQILHMLHQVVEALGLGGGHDKLAPGDEPGMGGPPPGPMGMDGPPDDGMGGPPGLGGGPAAPKKPTKLRPGEVLPTQTPIGSPAFSNVKVATITIESAQVNPQAMSPSQAATDITNQYGPQGYKIKQLAYDRTSGTYRALLSIH